MQPLIRPLPKTKINITTVDQICTQIMPVTVPIAIEKIFDQGTPDQICTALMPALCDALACDRCFLYLRLLKLGKVGLPIATATAPMIPT